MVVASQTILNLLKKKYSVAEERIDLLRPFIEKNTNCISNDASQAIKKQLGITENTFLVLGAGSVCDRKNPNAFIEVAKRLCEEEDNIQFLWLGGGDLVKSVDKVTEYDLLDKVHFVGHRSNIADYYLLGDVFLLTSKEDPCPQVCLEAASYGMPILSFSHCGDIPMIFGDDAGGQVELNDIKAMAELCSGLLHDRQRQKNLGQKEFLKYLLEQTL